MHLLKTGHKSLRLAVNLHAHYVRTTKRIKPAAVLNLESGYRYNRETYSANHNEG